MLKIIDKRNLKKEVIRFGDLKPGTIFQFVNATDSNMFWLFIRPNYVRGNVSVNSAVQLFGGFETITSLNDSEVIVVDAELQILKERKA